MTPAMDTITTAEDKALEILQSVEEPVADIVRKSAELVATYLPEDRPELPVVSQLDLPSPHVLVDNAFGFAHKVIDVQHRFAKAILAAAAPVIGEAPKAKPVKAAKPAAA